MKRLVVLGSVSLLLFLGSAALSWFLRGAQIARLDPEGEAGDPLAATLERRTRAARAVPETLPTLPAGDQRSVARPPYTAGTDEAVHLATTLRERLAVARDK